MHLLFFSPYHPPHTGGLENFTEELLTHLDKKNISVTLLTSYLPKIGTTQETKGKISILRFPAFEIVPGYPVPKFWSFKFWTAWRFASQKNPDIVIAQTRFFFTSVLALCFAKRHRIPFINLEHGSAFVTLTNPLTTFLSKCYDLTLGRLVLQKSDANVAISKAVQKFVKQLDLKRDATILYRGLNLQYIDSIPTDTSIKKQFPGKVLVATVARLYKWKGVENGIRAITSLPKTLKKDIVYIIAGNGEDFSKLSEMKDESVVLLGEIPHKNAIGILKACDIYLHTACPGGGLATTLLEAMYCECAVIATPNEGADEVIITDKNALCVNASDPKMICEKLIPLLHNVELRKQLGKNAKNTVQENFDWNHNIEKYKDFFEKLCR